MTRFGPDETKCSLCTSCPMHSVGNDLCAEWVHARSQLFSSAVRWHFLEYKPGHFAVSAPGRGIVLLTRDWDEVLTIYRARPAYIPPTTPIIRKPPAISGLTFNI